MGNDYSQFLPAIQQLPSNICVIHAAPYVFYGINLAQDLIKSMTEIYLEIWGKEVKIKPICPSIIMFKPHKPIMYTGDDAKNSAKTKLMFCRFQKIFCHFGWSLVSSPTLTFQFSLSTWFFYNDINPCMVQTGGTENEFCVIGLSSYDKLQFIDFPQALEQPIISYIRANWPKGTLEKELIHTESSSWTLQLNGTPWSSHGEQSLDARNLVLCLIRFMSHNNWRLVNSTAMKPDASDTMFFRLYSKAFSTDCPDSMPEYYFMLALMGKDYISVLGGDTVIWNSVADCCRKYEPKGIETPKMKHKYPSVTAVSDLWSRRREKSMETKLLITCIFQELAAIGWLPIESIDCTRSIRDLSSIAFVRIPPVRMIYFCLCPRQYKGICLINAVDEVQSTVYNTFVQYYAIRKDRIRRSNYGIAASIDFEGSPFRGGNTQGILLFQIALAAIISKLKDAGWFLVVSADTSNEILTRNKQSDIKWSIYGLWFAKLLAD